MTERVSELMHSAVDTIEIPPAPAARIVSKGHRLRARRRTTTAAGAAAALVLAGGGVAGLTQLDLFAPAGSPATAPAPESAPPAFAAGSTVYLGDVTAAVPGTVHSLHYTSAGVLVRSNANGGASDGSGPEALTLVRPDGSTEELGTVPEGVGPATDPTQPYYALAEAEDDGFVAVVRDAEAGNEVARVALPDLPPSFWEVPPLSLSGDTLYAGFKKTTAVVDVDTGDVTDAVGLPGGMPEVQGGRAVVKEFGSSGEVIDVATGESLLQLPNKNADWVVLSPTGAYAAELRFANGVSGGASRMDVHDVSAGTVQRFDGTDWGWTSDDELFQLDTKADTVTVCDAGTGACEDTPLPDPAPKAGQLRLGGVSYES